MTKLHLLFYLFLIVPSLLFSQDKNLIWDLYKCLVYGIQNHPIIKQAEGNVAAVKSQIGQTQASINDRLSFSASLIRQRQEFTRSVGGSLRKIDDMTDSTSESITWKKTLIDWGKTASKIRSVKANLESANAEKLWKMIQVAADIKISYLKVFQAKAQVKVQQDSLRRFEEHLEKVKAFVEVGTKPPYDVTKAEVDVANTRVNLIKAESAEKIAVANLAKAIGLDSELALPEKMEIQLPPRPLLDYNSILEEALQRPDVISALAQLKSAQFKVCTAQKSLSPTLSGDASYDWYGTATPLDRKWNIGISLSVPIFDGKLSHFQVKEAKAGLISAEAKVSQLKQSVKAEVESVITEINEAFQRLEATKLLLKQASESLQLAQGRYEAGLGSPIELTDARTTYSNAEGNHVNALFDILIALAKLDQVTGKFPPELFKAKIEFPKNQ